MKFLLIGDFHGKIPKIKKKHMDFDAILCTGDLAYSDEIRDLIFKNWELLKEKKIHEIVSKKKYVLMHKKAVNSQDKILNWLNGFNVPVFLISGNNDYDFYEVKKLKFFSPESLNKKVKKRKNIVLLRNKSIFLKNFQILGFSGYRGFNAKFENNAFLKKNESWNFRLKKLFKKMDKKCFNVFLAHDPPRGVLDKIKNKKSPVNGKHIGDEYFERFVKKFQPELMVCGHMHENQGKKKLEKTLVINAGYAYDNHCAFLEVNENKIKKVEFV